MHWLWGWETENPKILVYNGYKYHLWQREKKLSVVVTLSEKISRKNAAGILNCYQDKFNKVLQERDEFKKTIGWKIIIIIIGWQREEDLKFPCISVLKVTSIQETKTGVKDPNEG